MDAELKALLVRLLEKEAPEVAAAINPTAGAVARAAVQILETTGVLPVVDDPKAHDVIIAAGRAPQVPLAQPPDAPANPDATVQTVEQRIMTLEAKVNALVAAVGLEGSAAMAAHA